MFIIDIIDVGGRKNPGMDLVATKPLSSMQQHASSKTTGFHHNRAYTYSFLPWQMIPRNDNPPP
jgi:hypothetical protein